VSSGWHGVVKNQHIWRESFLREKTTTYATSGPVRPGVGLGVPRVQPENNWKEIYRVKTELDKRWKEGKAQPVYLNGHTDSIYCLQFDECVFLQRSKKNSPH
jgi:F-box and WD-40 domain protein 1/11